MGQRPRHFMLGGIIALVVGIILFVAGLLVGFLVPDAVDKGVQATLPTYKAEPGDEDYEKWLNNNYDTATPYYRGYTFFNITNLDDVQQSGAIPVVEPIGPYVYRYYTTKFNVEFLNDGELAQFQYHNDFFFQPDMSAPGVDPLNDIITTVNPSYMVVLNNPSIPSEQRLQNIPISSVWVKMMNAMETYYVPAGLRAVLPGYLETIQNQLIATIMNDDSVSAQEATLTFYNIFANSTTDPSYAGFNSTMRISTSTSLDYSLTQIGALMSSSSPLGLTNPAAFEVWYAAEAIQDPTAISTIMTNLGLTQAQFTALLQWRYRFLTSITPQILSDFSLTSTKEIALYQWATGNFAEVDPKFWWTTNDHVEFAYIAEAYFGLTGGISMASARALYNAGGAQPLTDRYNVIKFIENQVEMGNFGTPNAFYSTSTNQTQAIYGYFKKFIGDNIVSPLITPGGLFRSQSPNNWLWDSQDPLLTLLGSPNTTNFFSNASMTDPADTYKTGHKNIDDIMQYVRWEDKTQLDGVWRTPEVVSGTDATHFQPKLKKTEDLYTWVSELLRKVHLVYLETVKLYGIELYRYVIADDVLDTSDNYYQTIRGFGNMTSGYQGAPIFLSKPYFLDADTTYLKIQGIVSNRSRDDIMVDVDPISGTTMRALKRLQLNAFPSSALWSSKFNLYNEKTPKDMFYPIVAVDQFSQLTEKQAHDYKAAVYTPLKAAKVVLGVGVALGAVGMIIGVVLIIVAQVQRKKGGNSVEMY